MILEITYEYKFADDLSERLYNEEKIKVQNKIKYRDSFKEIHELLQPHNYPYNMII